MEHLNFSAPSKIEGEKLPQQSSQEFFTSHGFNLAEVDAKQLEVLNAWHLQTSTDTGSGLVFMPDPDSFRHKTFLLASLWPQKKDGSVNWLLAKGAGAELALQGEVLNRETHEFHREIRSHADFEVYACDTNDVGELAWEAVSEDSTQAIEVFKLLELYPETFTKGMKDLPKDLMRSTAETVRYDGTSYLIPQLELLFLDKWQAPESAVYREREADHLLIARKFNLNHQLLHEYLDRFVIEWRKEYITSEQIRGYHEELDRILEEACNLPESVA